MPSPYEYPDVLPNGPAHRRGAGINPANRFESIREHVDGETLDQLRAQQHESVATNRLPRIALQVLPDRTQTIINRVSATSDVPFDWTLNPYRGCEHGCIYCYARPFHEYLGFNMGLDFETKIMAKHDAPDLLRRELAHKSWAGEPIVMSAITDIYQPIEHELKIARQCLQVLADCNQPVSTMTKSAMVLRDVDLWQRLAAHDAGRVTITLVTLDAELAQQLEPRATSPQGRLRTIRELTRAGVPVWVNIAPVIPGLTHSEVPQILEAVADAGAVGVAWVMLRLPYQLKELFIDWLKRCVHPKRAEKVQSFLRQTHNGKLYDSSSVVRRRGEGVLSDQIKNVFDVFTRRYKLNMSRPTLSGASFIKPTLDGQLSLFK